MRWIFPEITHSLTRSPVVCVDAGLSISSVSWSSVLQQDLSRDDVCERLSSAVDLSNADLTGEEYKRIQLASITAHVILC